MMKKLFATGSALALVAIAAAGIAFAGDPAIVIKDGACTLLDANGDFFPADSSQSVVSGGESGNRKITCSAQTDTYPDQAVQFNYESTLGTPCNVNGVLTDKWHAVVTPSGKAMLSCHVNPSAP